MAIDVAAHRTAKGWSQADLAEEAGISVRTIRRIEAGEGVSTETMERVRLALNLGDIDEGDEQIQASIERIETSRYRTGMTVLRMIMIVAMLFGATVFAIWIFDPRPFPASSMRLPIATLCLAVLGLLHEITHQRRQFRCEREIEPDCRRVIRAVASGRLRILTHRTHSVVADVLGLDILADACNSRHANVVLLTEGLPADIRDVPLEAAS